MKTLWQEIIHKLELLEVRKSWKDIHVGLPGNYFISFRTKCCNSIILMVKQGQHELFRQLKKKVLWNIDKRKTK